MRLPRICNPLDIDDGFLLAGTLSATAGLWYWDFRVALCALGIWLIALGMAGPRRGRR